MLPIEEPPHPANIPAGDPEEPQDPGNFNPVPAQPPVPMANNQLNCSDFRPEFSGKPKKDVEAHSLRMEDWMTTHDFPEDQKVRRFCLTLTHANQPKQRQNRGESSIKHCRSNGENLR